MFCTVSPVRLLQRAQSSLFRVKTSKSTEPLASFRAALFFSFFFLQIFSRVISTFSPEFMSHSLLWPGEQETHLSADSLFSPGFFLWPLRQRKGKHGGQLERPLTASLSLKRDRKEGWLWELVDHLLYLFSCTDTITETYKKNIFFIYNMRWNVKGFMAGVRSVLTAAPLLFLTINVPSAVI